MQERSPARNAHGRTARSGAEARNDTRERLLDAGMTLFTADGIYTTRIDAVTERAHVAKGTFYIHFESKEALVGELLLEGIEILERRYLDRVAPSACRETHMAELARRHEEFLRDEPGYAVLLHQLHGLMLVPTPHQEPLREVLHHYLRMLAERLAPSLGAASTPEERMKLAGAFACALFGRRPFALDLPGSGEAR